MWRAALDTLLKLQRPTGFSAGSHVADFSRGLGVSRGESASHARTVSPTTDVTIDTPTRTTWTSQRVERSHDTEEDAVAPVNC